VKSPDGQQLGVGITVVLIFAFFGTVSAQQQKKIPRIGYLAGNILNEDIRLNAFRQGLRQLGYAEGKNIVIESRSAGALDRLNELATELVRLKVDVIVTRGPPATRAAKAATATIPIVMTQDPDPVANGFVASVARPGGNITGLSSLAPETSGKQLELLKETVPKLSRVAVLSTSTNPGQALQLREIGLAAGPLGVQLQSLDVLGPKISRLHSEPQATSTLKPSSCLGAASSLLKGARIVEYMVKNRLPAIYSSQPLVDVGGLMSYGVNATDLDRRAAIYVNKILKGARPGDLPVEQPKKFDLIINLKTAKQIRLIIPPNVLARADRVIK
jgi:ABC-type uncharacterized transport system substrate-binding protein